MHANRFDDLSRKLSIVGTRRGLLRVLAIVPAIGLLAEWLEEETEAGRRSRRARHRSRGHNDKKRLNSQRKSKKDKNKGKKKDAPPCANAGQTPKKGKRCCQGLAKDGTGRCASPAPVPNPSGCATTCSGCCAGETCITATTNAACGTGGAPCAPCIFPQTCGGGTTASVCGCAPISDCPSNACGDIANGCGTGTIFCGGCTLPDTCGGDPTKPNTCGCTPTCPSNACGLTDNGCNGTILCNTCAGSTPICTDQDTCVACSAENPCPAGALCRQDGSCIPCTVCASGCPFQSVQAAVGGPGGTIYICPGTYNETIAITKKVTLIGAGSGGGPEDTILDADGSGRVVTIGQGIDVHLEGLRITRGDARGETPSPDGGGIFNDTSSLSITGCVLSQNQATGGGGIFNIDGMVLVTNSKVQNNAAGLGGGILNEIGMVTLDGDTSVTENDAGTDGGGIYNHDTVTLNDGSSVTGNTVGGDSENPNNCSGPGTYIGQDHCGP